MSGRGLYERIDLELSIDPQSLNESASYTVKLVYVDFNGWVSAIAEKSFIFRSATNR